MEAKRSAFTGRFGRSQPGRSQADVVNKSRTSVRASQPGSSQAGGQNGPLWTGGKQENGATASSFLWQAGV
ncbi:hypothetical protein VSR68_30520 [Paraburkholderia phymatum]|uniref:hypothetical protein n=1 Tax=Paraburkholderia phymatum TaxID=148447 RepID=UPI00317D5225